MTCDWNHPGADPYWGRPVAAAVASYGYPKRVQEVIIEKVVSAKPDGVAVITYDRALWGSQPIELHDMHWGTGRCVGPVNRKGWNMFREERALVYCGGPGQCVALPFICGNVSRVVFGVTPPPSRLNTDPPRPLWEGAPPEAPPWVGKVPKQTRPIPAPSTLLLALTALGLLAWKRR